MWWLQYTKFLFLGLVVLLATIIGVHCHSFSGSPIRHYKASGSQSIWVMVCYVPGSNRQVTQNPRHCYSLMESSRGWAAGGSGGARSDESCWRIEWQVKPSNKRTLKSSFIAQQLNFCSRHTYSYWPVAMWAERMTWFIVKAKRWRLWTDLTPFTVRILCFTAL